MIQNITFGVYLLISDFLVERLKANKNYQKDHLFYNTVSLKKNPSFYNPQLSQFILATQPKNSLYKFSSKHVFGWYQKKHLNYTIPRRPRTTFSKHLESKCLYIPVDLRKKFFTSET